MRKLLLVMLAILVFMSYALATDLNLSFEDNSDLPNWGVFVGASGYTTKAWDASAGVGGSGAMYFTDAGYGLMMERQSINVPDGNNYSLSVDVKVADWTSSNDLTLSIIGLSNSEPSVVISDNSTFTTVTLNGVADKATSGYLRISGTGNTATPEIWIDNLVFDDNTEAAPEPTNVYVLDLRQDDNHYLEITDNANNDLDLGSDFTIEAWIYIKDATHGNERIFRSQGWQMYVVSGTGSGGADASVRVDGSFLTGGGSITMSVPTEEWHHVAIQGNSVGGWTNNYLDGVAGFDGGASSISGSLNLRIGSYSTTDTDFIGCIDEVRISNVCRYGRYSFSVNKNDAPFTSDANTVLLYHFDDGATPPTNSSSKVFSVGHSGITSGDYLAYNDASLSDEIPLPITLTSFTAKAKNGTVELDWETATETNNSHFIIYRNGEAIATVNGAGSSTEPNTYSYVDETVIPGVAYTYVLADVDYASEETRYEENAVTVMLDNDIIATDFIVDAAYPNPFNPSVAVNYQLSVSSVVKALIYNSNGMLVEELLNSNMTAGSHELVWNATNMPSGVYILKMSAGNTVNTQKLVLTK